MRRKQSSLRAFLWLPRRLCSLLIIFTSHLVPCWSVVHLLIFATWCVVLGWACQRNFANKTKTKHFWQSFGFLVWLLPISAYDKIVSEWRHLSFRRILQTSCALTAGINGCICVMAWQWAKRPLQQVYWHIKPVHFRTVWYYLTLPTETKFWTYAFHSWVNTSSFLAWRMGWISPWTSPFSCSRSCTDTALINCHSCLIMSQF